MWFRSKSDRVQESLMVRLVAMLISLGRLEYRLFKALLAVVVWPVLLIWRILKLITTLKTSFRTVKAYGQAIQSQLPRSKKLSYSDRWRAYLASIARSFKNRAYRQPSFAIKPLVAFAVLALVVVAPLKFYDTLRFFQSLEGRLTRLAEAAVGQIGEAKTAAMAKDLEAAHLNFSQASQDFVSAGQELAVIDGALMKLLKMAPNEKLKMAGSSQKLVLAGQLATGLAADLSEAAAALMIEQSGRSLTQALTAFSLPGERALYKLEELTPVLAEIDSEALPAEYRETFEALRDKSVLVSASLKNLLASTEQLQIFLGRDMDKRYLLVFQNNTEARATGGFMGSFAVIDFKQGEIKNIESPGGGTYDTEGGLRRLVTAPRPMWLVNPLWHLWDANWWPDWRKSAQKIMWFYEKSDGSTVDGVISLTPDVVMKLLAVIGPIDLTAKHGVIITPDNFMDTVQAIAEQKQHITLEPKQIIGDMMMVIMERLPTLNQEQYLQIVKVLEESLSEKDILLYLTDADLQQRVEAMGWDGRIKSVTGDYLAVINTNIAGAKSDKRISQTVTHEAKISADGSIFDTVTIVREHKGQKGELFSGVRNVNWLRVYVPLGSRLISSSGWRVPEIALEQPKADWELDPALANETEAETESGTGTLSYREQDKTVFANWSMIDPGEMAVIKLVYKLPFRLETSGNDKELFYKYNLLIQKQAGTHNSEISASVAWPDNLKAVWQYPEQNTTSFYEQDLDRSWAYLFQAK